MKVIAILLFAVTMETMSSCSKEDIYQRKIVGKWSKSKETYFFYDASNTLVYSYESSSELGLIYEFINDGEVILGGLVSTTYSLEGNVLKFKGDSYEIEELTNTTMVWKEREEMNNDPRYAYYILKTEFKKLSN